MRPWRPYIFNFLHNNMSEVPPLFVPPNPPVPGIAFGTDKFGRKPLATALTGYVKRLRFGAVLAIEAEWGEGKTWFAQNWKRTLDDQGQTAIYIDAFEADYIEDPFSIIAGAIHAVIKSEAERKNFVSKAASVALTIAPTLLKAAVRGGGKLVFGIPKLDEAIKDGAESILESTEESLGKILENKISNYAEDKKSIASFRTSLAEFALAKDDPIVIIIDELDRCKPEFAVKLLERIKHFFNVNNVVFVLFMNKKQLQNAIRGVYGDATDAHLYLEKFLNFTFILEAPTRKHVRPFLETEIKKYSIEITTQIDEYLTGLSLLSQAFRLTTRQLERAIALLALAHPFQTGGILLAEMAVLKICRPELLEGLLRHDADSIGKILEALARPEGANGNGEEEGFRDFFLTAHRAQLEAADSEHTEALRKNFGMKKEAIKRDYAKFVKLLNMMDRA